VKLCKFLGCYVVSDTHFHKDRNALIFMLKKIQDGSKWIMSVTIDQQANITSHTAFLASLFLNSDKLVFSTLPQ
jgi:hypothetical protein